MAKARSTLITYLILSTLPLACMQAQKKDVLALAIDRAQKTPKTFSCDLKKQPLTRNFSLLIHCMVYTDAYHRILKENSDLEQMRNWFVSISLVNKYLFNRANKAHTVRSLIKSIAKDNDHYTEETIARTLNTPATRHYIKINSQLFDKNLTLEEIKRLRRQKIGADVNYRKNDYSLGATPLIYFIYQKKCSKVRQLLELQADMNHYCTIDPLSASIQIAHLPIFHLLMKHKPHNFDLYYPLRYAMQGYAELATPSTQPNPIQEKYKNIIITLLDAGADATEALIYAIEQEYFHPFLIKTLILNYNADPNEAFIPFMNYVFTQEKLSQSHINIIMKIFKKSPLFKKEENQTLLLERIQRLTKLETMLM